MDSTIEATVDSDLATPLPDTERFVYLPVNPFPTNRSSHDRNASNKHVTTSNKAEGSATSRAEPKESEAEAPIKRKLPSGEASADGLAGDASKKKKKTKVRRDHRYISKQSLRPAIHSVDVVRQNLKPYYEFTADKDPQKVTDEAPLETIQLVYPGEKAIETFPLVVPAKTAAGHGEYNPVQDLYLTVQTIGQNCLNDKQREIAGDTRNGIIRSIVKYCHKKSPQQLKQAVLDFNKVMTGFKDDGAFEQNEIRGAAAKPPLVDHILEQAYCRSVAPSANLLNNYEGFSNNVYGEIKHSFVRELIKQADIQPHHIFLDMGSGIGNVVLQVAAECLCECYGIEIMEIPCELAKKQKAEFLSRMRYYAKPCGRVVLKQGDFLEDEEINQVISKADVIFVNNYAFDAALNQGILAKFLDLKENARIISLRSFVPVDRRPSLRNINAIESIFTVKEYHFGRDSCSWMVEGGSYFIHTVDRSQLANLTSD